MSINNLHTTRPIKLTCLRNSRLCKAHALIIWLDTPGKTYVLEEEGQILGTYYIKTNQAGPGSHVCICGYMVSSKARGRGLATTMCEHSQQVANELGYKAMQFISLPPAMKAQSGYGKSLVLKL